LTTCPACGGAVKIYTEDWLGDSKAKVNIEKIKELAKQNCKKCGGINNDRQSI
jgi:transcription initiation factor IIE alpha subunit